MSYLRRIAERNRDAIPAEIMSLAWTVEPWVRWVDEITIRARRDRVRDAMHLADPENGADALDVADALAELFTTVNRPGTRLEVDRAVKIFYGSNALFLAGTLPLEPLSVRVSAEGLTDTPKPVRNPSQTSLF